MKRALTITTDPIDEGVLTTGRERRADAGAVICFTGVVRDTEAEAPIAALEYEAFQRMAEHQFGLLFDEVEKRWPVLSIRLVHRVGRVNAGEASLWVEAAAPHRGEAFAACQWLIDEMKRVVPIWKKAVPARTGFPS